MKKIAIALLFSLAFVRFIAADHGPGTTGATGSVIMPDTIERHHFALSLTQSFTSYAEYPDVAISDATQKMKTAGSHIDTLSLGSISNATLGYGILSWLDASATIGWYYGRRLREGVLDSNTAYKLIDAGNVAGLTDVWLNGKAKFFSGGGWNLAALGGVKLPTGNLAGASESVSLNSLPAARVSGGDFPQPSFHVVAGAGGTDQFSLDPSATPGSGSVDFMAGLAASKQFADVFTLTTSGSYIYRGYYKTYKVGDRIDGGVALSYKAFDADGYRFFAFTELTARYMMKSKDHDATVTNSGGLLGFWAVGLRLSLPHEVGIFASKEFPVVQILNEPQQKLDGRLNVGASWNFSLYAHHEGAGEGVKGHGVHDHADGHGGESSAALEKKNSASAPAGRPAFRKGAFFLGVAGGTGSAEGVIGGIVGMLNAEYAITNEIGLGLSTGYWRYSEALDISGTGSSSITFQYSVVPIVATGAYHFNVGNPKLDLAAGALFGYYIVNATIDAGSSFSISGKGNAVAYGVFGLARYFLSDSLALRAKVGYGVTLAEAGIDLRF